MGLELDTVFENVERNRRAYLNSLLAYLSIPSVSATGEGIEESAAHIAGVLRQIGFEVDVVESEGPPFVVASLVEDPAQPTILFYGHYDVQPADPLDAWLSPPFSPEVRDGRVYARGAGDNKGQHLANVLGLASLRSVRGRLPCNVKVLLDGEEEIGSPSLPRFVEAHARRLSAELVIVSDGPLRPSGEPCLVFGVRGILCFELLAKGARADLHSGNWGGVVRNPLWELVHVLASLRDREGNVTVGGVHDHVRAPSALERRALSRLPVDLEAVKAELGVTALEVEDAESFAARLAYAPSLCINGIQGGYDGPGVKTVLPHAAVAKCDLRLVADQSCDDVFRKLEAHVRAASPDVRVVRSPGSMEPSVTPLDTRFAEPVRRAILAGQGAEPVLVPVLGGSAPNYVFTAMLGCPALLVPYANPDEANHAPNENLELDRFFAGIRTGAAIVAHVGAM